ncbi:MAG: T9SS type A sorting domain-containing protein [Chlorobi bacterium]|nr:T9SS type A sorting domain-containing protein [Chlorobiota bacterium]
MRKLVLLSLILSLCVTGFSQKKPTVTEAQKHIMLKAEYLPPVSDLGMFEPHGTAIPSAKAEAQIGTTTYDLQSNSSLGNRITMFNDGTVGGVWTGSWEDAWGERGTGYNYFNGEDWGPMATERIETDRTGWPSYAPLGENGEIIVSHLSNQSIYTDGGLLINTRETKGEGDWTEVYYPGPDDSKDIYWPRVTTSGPDNNFVHIIHVMNKEYLGMTDALLYSRSSDGGQSWDIEFEQLEGTGSDYYSEISADRYTFAESRGSTVAFVVSSPWYTDWFVMKSMDNGETWEKLMVWEHPFPFWDWDATLVDSMWTVDGAADVAIDANGMVHTVSGLTRIAHTEPGTSYNYWPYAEGIVYWNESMGPLEDPDGDQTNALNAWDGVIAEDVNLVGWGQDVDGDGQYLMELDAYTYRTIGLQTMPNIACSEGQIFIVWASTTETFDNGTSNFKHVWTRRSPDNGTTWGYFYDLNSDLIHIFDECVYPTIAGSTDGSIHVLYQLDNDPGTALDSDHPVVENKMTYYTSLIDDLYVGVNENAELISSVDVSQNYPNPFNTTSVVKVKLEQKANLSLQVTSLTGQVVYEINEGDVNTGMHSITINASNLTSGVYFYTVKAGESTVTKKMIVE